MKRYDTVLFDLDGTILDTLDDLTDSMNHVLRAYGYAERTREQVQSFIGNGVLKLVERALPAGTAADRVQEAYAAFKTYYTAHCDVKTRPYPGMQALLTALRERGVTVGVVSNKNDAAVKALCASHYAGSAQVAIGGRDDMPRKPAPDLALLALRELGQTAERLLYVGDSEVDSQLAQAIPCDCALVSWGFRGRERAQALAPDYLIDRPEQLLALFE
ncbi:MAG: HAD-IA family hydrolase [Eubacteriales bacterium]|nr:HAD-IA family hydrolase [Eubacteriales bacterium]